MRRNTVGNIFLCVGLFGLFALSLIVVRVLLGETATIRALIFWALVSTAVIAGAMRASLLREQQLQTSPKRDE